MAIGITPVTEPGVVLGLREVSKGLDAARDALPFETDPGVLGDALCELVGLQTALDSLRLQLVDQCRTNAVPQTVGVRTVGQYVAARTNNAPAGPNMDTAMNKWLRDYRIFIDALQTRDMTMAHLRYIKRHLSSGRSFDALRNDQQFLADAARDCSFKDFTKVCDYWLMHIDPDGEEPKDQLESCGLTMRKGLGGRGKIEIETDAVTFAAFKKMIDHEVARLNAAKPQADDSDSDSPVVDPYTGTGKARQRLQALLSLAQRGHQREDGTRPSPLFNMVMSPALVDWATNQLAGANADTVPVDPFDVDRRCELIDGTPIHPLLAVAIGGLWNLDTPTLCRYILNAKDRIIDYSYNTRIAPEHLRTSAHIEHRGACATTGCDADHNWLQIDHINPHTNGGPTSLPNSEPRCQADNQAKAASLGHIPFKDRPPIPKYLHRPSVGSDRSEPDDEDADVG